MLQASAVVWGSCRFLGNSLASGKDWGRRDGVVGRDAEEEGMVGVVAGGAGVAVGQDSGSGMDGTNRMIARCCHAGMTGIRQNVLR